MKNTPFSEQLRSMLPDERIVKAFEPSIPRKIAATNSHYKDKYFACGICVLIDSKLKSEKVCVITGKEFMMVA